MELWTLVKTWLAESRFRAIDQVQAGQLQVQRVDSGPRDRLAVTERQSDVFIGSMPNSLRDKGVSRDRIECLQDREIRDPSSSQRFNQAEARSFVRRKTYRDHERSS